MPRACGLRSIIVALTLFTVSSTAVHAQKSRSIGSYWRDVSVALSTDELNAIRPPDPMETKVDSSIATAIRNIREYELTLDKTKVFVTARNLEKLIEKSPDDAWAHFALGTLLARGPDIRAHDFAESNAYQPQAYSLAAERAPRELKRALELDPTMDDAAIELGNLALEIGQPEHIREAIDILMASGRQSKWRALLLASKLENKLLSAKRAANMAYEARIAGADPSLAAHQRALSLYRVEELRGTNDDIASNIYFSGIDSLTTEGAETYYKALELLVSPVEKKKWDAADLEGRKQWLRHFWDMHAGLAGVSPARRVTEHYTRLERVELTEHPPMFTTEKVAKRKGIFGWIFGTKPTVVELHDEIISIIRHGDPNLSKKYLLCTPGFDTLPIPLQPKIEDCAGTTYGVKQYRERNAHTLYRSQLKAAAGESFYPRYNYHIGTAWEFLQFRAREGGAEVVTTAAVEGSAADKLLSLAGELRPVITVSLVDTINDWVRVAHSEERVSSKAFTADWIMLFNASVAAPAGKNVALRVAVENATYRAGRIDYGTVDIEAFDPSQLTMSDIVLSPPGELGGFKRGNVTMTLAPGRKYRLDEVPTLYYEVYGIARDEPITTEVRIEPVRESVIDALRSKLGRSDGALAVQFTEKAAEPVPQFGLQQKRDIGLSQLVPGDYRIRVTVTETATGRTTSRVRSIHIDPTKE